MKKLALNVDELSVQSFETSTAPRQPGGTVRGCMDDDNGGDGGGEYSDLCPAVYSCATCDTCDDACKEQQRRIILY